jgi:GT2 family glycosyltransferase
LAVGPKISVVVPVRDDAPSLRSLVASIAEQTLSASRYETVVVDNGSTDDTAEVARAAGARVVAVPQPSRARARNAGVAAAEHDLIAFVDADCIATPTWLEGLVGCAGRAPFVAGPVTVTTGDPPNAVERLELLWRFEQEGWVREGWAATANLMVERAAFESIGGFDETYGSIGEDADLCLRARDAGIALAYCSGAEILHPGEDELWPALKRFFWHGYSGVQITHRLGEGYQAWRHPTPLLSGDRAAAVIGAHRERVDGEREWASIRRLSRAGYAARVVGSVWGELKRVR